MNLPNPSRRARGGAHELALAPASHRCGSRGPAERASALAPLLASFALVGALAGCGSDSETDTVPPPGTAMVSTGALVDGVLWQVNRPIEITFPSAVDPATITGFHVRVEDLTAGDFVDAELRLGIDPATGLDLQNVIVLQPACSSEPGGAFGFAQGHDLQLQVLGADTTSLPLRYQSGEALAETIAVDFRTPLSSDPAVVFFDAVAGPPAFVVRGDAGVAPAEPEALLIEIGTSAPVTYGFVRAQAGGLAAAPAAVAAYPSGLPLNHWVEPRHRTTFVVAFNQPIDPDPANVARIRLEFLSAGAWRPLFGERAFTEVCGRRGSVVRFTPAGTLPPAAPLRIALAPGFRDLVGEARPSSFTVDLPVAGTAAVGGPGGARVDAVLEEFSPAGPGSMEDTTSDLGAPRAIWGPVVLTGLLAGDGVSRARSKWYAVGHAGLEPGAPREAPEFVFFGTDAKGRVRTAGGTVMLEAPVVGPLPPFALAPFTVDLQFTDLIEPSGFYSAFPSMLRRDRLRLGPLAAPFDPVDPPIFNVQTLGSTVRASVGAGCYFPAAFGGDCAPWNLAASYPDPSLARFEVVPQSFEVYARFGRDILNPDARITILFDATRAGADGAPDANAAYSLVNGWTPDPAVFSGTEWDFVRFEVLFELDVSGDGFGPGEVQASLDFVKLPIDLRR